MSLHFAISLCRDLGGHFVWEPEDVTVAVFRPDVCHWQKLHQGNLQKETEVLEKQQAHKQICFLLPTTPSLYKCLVVPLPFTAHNHGDPSVTLHPRELWKVSLASVQVHQPNISRYLQTIRTVCFPNKLKFQQRRVRQRPPRQTFGPWMISSSPLQKQKQSMHKWLNVVIAHCVVVTKTDKCKKYINKCIHW